MGFDNLVKHRIVIYRGLDGNDDDWSDVFDGDLIEVREQFVALTDRHKSSREIFVPIAQIKYMTHDRGSCRVCDPSYEDKRPTSYDPNWRFTSDR